MAVWLAREKAAFFCWGPLGQLVGGSRRGEGGKGAEGKAILLCHFCLCKCWPQTMSCFFGIVKMQRWIQTLLAFRSHLFLTSILSHRSPEAI